VKNLRRLHNPISWDR